MVILYIYTVQGIHVTRLPIKCTYINGINVSTVNISSCSKSSNGLRSPKRMTGRDELTRAHAHAAIIIKTNSKHVRIYVCMYVCMYCVYDIFFEKRKEKKKSQQNK